MKKGIIAIVALIIICICSPVLKSYSEKDLWILELIVNDISDRSRIVESVVTGEDIFLPVSEVASLLEIDMEVDKEKGIYKFKKPVSCEEMKINANTKEIFMDGVKLFDLNDMYIINGRIYYNINCLAYLLNVEFEYDSKNLVIHIFSEYVDEQENEDNFGGLEVENKRGTENSNNEVNNIFTITNIDYNLKGNLLNKSFNEDYLDDWNLSLDLDTKGTIYDWKYYLGIKNEVESKNNLSTELKTYKFVYDLDNATFKAGRMGVKAEEELDLDKSVFTGFSLFSDKSPLVSSGNKIIDIHGESTPGSEAVLYVNGWETDEQIVNDDGYYNFKDIVIYKQERANEIMVRLIKPSGEKVEKYRYISVSESILEKDDINYLTQLGKLDKGNVLYNSMLYWGAEEDTTLGLGMYGEFEDFSSCFLGNPEYTFNSLRINHQLADNLLLKSKLYQKNRKENSENDTGYKLGLDFAYGDLQSGVEYHKQAEQLNLKKDKRLDPVNIFKFYYVQDITPDEILEGKYINTEERYNQNYNEDHYEISYKIRKKYWETSLNYSRSLQKDYTKTKIDNFAGSFSYLVTPNMEIINELGYESIMEKVMVENLNYGIKNVIKDKRNSYLLGVKWKKNLAYSQLDKTYNLAWERRWPLDERSSLTTDLSLNYNTENKKTKIPLGIKYSYQLKNDSRLGLNYYAILQKDSYEDKTEHCITASWNGSFNIFDGQIVGTSPDLFEREVGLVEGVVYRDDNFNGRRDENEKLLAGMPVKLGGQFCTTDENGKFIFKQVSSGKHVISFDYNQLPIELTPAVFEKSVVVEANSTTNEELGVYVVGAVDGKITPENFKEEISLAGIKLTAEPGGFETYTDYRGYYFFELPMGEYEIKIDEKTLPDWINIPEGCKNNIKITDKGEHIPDIDFRVLIEKEKSKDVEKSKKEKTEKINILKPSTKINENIEDKKKITQKKYMEREISYLIRNDEIWAPLREIADAFEAKIFWDGTLKEIYIIDGEDKLLFNVKLGYALKNGKRSKLNGIELINDYTFVTLEDLWLLDISSDMTGDEELLLKKPVKE